MKKVIYLLVLSCLVLMVLVGIEAYKVTKGAPDWDIDLLSEHGCNLQKEKCSFLYKGKSFDIIVVDKPILINKKHSIEIRGQFDGIDEVWIDFKGLEIDMGHNRVKLNREGMKYKGQIYLPSCSLNIMTWKAIVLMKSGDKRFGFRYKFQTVKNEN